MQEKELTTKSLEEKLQQSWEYIREKCCKFKHSIDKHQSKEMSIYYNSLVLFIEGMYVFNVFTWLENVHSINTHTKNNLF